MYLPHLILASENCILFSVNIFNNWQFENVLLHSSIDEMLSGKITCELME